MSIPPCRSAFTPETKVSIAPILLRPDWNSATALVVTSAGLLRQHGTDDR